SESSPWCLRISSHPPAGLFDLTEAFKMSRQIGLAPLSSLSTPPDQLVRLAAATGFSFVGLRVIAVTPNEPVYDLSPGSPLLAATQQALKETGLYVLDTE